MQTTSTNSISALLRTTEVTPRLDVPRIVIQKTRIGMHRTFVVRDDLLPGGTKQRGVLDLVEFYARCGYEELIYASPFCGFAQIALSYACQRMGLRCTLFCGQDCTVTEALKAHPFTEQAQRFGANIRLFKTLDEATAHSVAYSERARAGLLVPLGFDCEKFYAFYSRAIAQEWNYLVEEIGFVPKTVWLPIGSGTLVRTFLKVLPTETKIAAVNVQVLKKDDARMMSLQDLEQVTVYDSTLAFCQKEKDIPSFPSNVHYDAKLHSFIKTFGQDDDVWWNVAR